MSEKDTYTIKEMLIELKDDFKERFDRFDKSQDVLNKTVSEHSSQLNIAKGAIIVLSVIVIPLCIYVWDQSQKIQERLQSLSETNQTYK